MPTRDFNNWRTPAVLVLIFVFLVAGIVTAASFYYRNYERQFRAEAGRQLSAIAELKVNELARYRKERLWDAGAFFENPAFSGLARRFFDHPEDAEARQQIREWAGKYVATVQYDLVCLFDAQGVVRMSVPAERPPISSFDTQRIPEVLRSGQVTFQDFHRNEHDQLVYLTLLVPILDKSDANRPLGVLALRIDPETYLYPFLRRWPTPSLPAETLLVRRDGNDALCLNNLQFRPNTALNLRYSLENTNAAAVKAVLGQTGIVEARDHFGAPVLAALYAISDSPWYLVTRMDTVKVYAPLRERLRLTILIVSLLLVSAGVGLGAFWWHQRLQFYQERYEMAETLRESEDRFRRVFEESPTGMAMLDGTFQFIRVNQAFVSMLGYSENELQKMAFTDITHPDHVQKDIEQVRRLLNSDLAVYRTEKRYIAKSRNELWGQTHVTVVRGADGAFRHFLAIISNINERKWAEEELRDSQALYHSLVENLPQSVFRKDRAGHFLFVNERFCRDLGRSFEEIVGKTDADFFPPELAQAYRKDDLRVMETGQVLDQEEKHMGASGREQFAHVIKTPLRDATGKVIGIQGVFWDITARKQAEKALRRSHGEFKDLFDNAPAGFHEVDTEGRLVRINNTELEMLGYSAEELLGQFVWKISTEEEACRQSVLAKLGGEMPPSQTLERIFRRKDGFTYPVLINDRILRGKDGAIVGIRSAVQDDTARKQAETALKENQRQLAEVNEMLQMVMDTIPVRIFWKNTDLVYMGCNRLFAEDAGRKSPEEIIGETDYDMGWREQAELYRKDDLEIIRSGNAKLNYEEPQTAPDGKQLWLRTSKVPLRGINNRIVGILGTYEDITERKRAEEALHFERTLTTTLMDNIPDGVYFKDAASRFLRVNQAQVRKLGVSDPYQAIGKSDADFFSGEHAQQALADEQKIIRTGRPLLNVEEKETWPDGTVTWVVTTKLPLRDAAGRIIGTCGISRDITERKRMEQALAERAEEVVQRNQELAGANANLQQQIAVRERIEKVLEGERNLLRTLIDSLPDYVYAKDAEGRFTVANVGVARQAGCSSSNEVIGKSDFDLFPHELAAKYRAEEQEILRSGQGLHSYEGPTVDASKKEKNRWVSTTKMPLRNDLGEITGFVGLGHDITERKRVEQALQERNDELARFAYTVSHDLKSPLVTIRAFLGYLEQDTASQDTEAIKKDRQYIHTAVDKMTRLLEELLDLARIGHKMNPPEEVPLQVVVKDALDMVAGGIIQRGVEVVVTKEPIILCGDRTRLVEVFQNLVDNATKFMGDQQTPRVEIGVETAGDERVFFVRDNGIGIDPRYQPKLFGLFEKFDPGTKGTGIGLALVKRIVEVHGGKIWVESAGVGKGTTFHFTLAKTQPHPAQP
jgi:PAS domain S-box-containing protein